LTVWVDAGSGWLCTPPVHRLAFTVTDERYIIRSISGSRSPQSTSAMVSAADR
jgi:hypothetical protein